MSRFAIRNPYFIVVVCLIIGVVGLTTLLRMPVDMFPAMNIPVVACATFYSGMPPGILNVEFSKHLMQNGMPVREAVITACHQRLLAVVITTLAPIIRLLPVARLGTGSEPYAAIASAFWGRSSISALCTVFVVMAAFPPACRKYPELQEAE